MLRLQNPHLIHTGHHVGRPLHRPRHRLVCHHGLRMRLHPPQLRLARLQLCYLAPQPDQLPRQHLCGCLELPTGA